jgi:hypothetical protein
MTTFKKREWNFYDFPKFSSNYYCHSKNFFLGDAFATNHRLGLIEKQNHILIEIKQDILIAKYPRDFNHLDFSNFNCFH